MTDNRMTERVDHPPRVREAIDELMREKDAADNRTTELELLSKLKMAGRLRYWRGTIEIPEIELHAICDEIQAEYDNAVHALNKSAGNWAKADAELREKGEAMTDNRTAELLRCLENDWNISASWDGLRRFWNIELTEEGVRLRDELNARAERTCECVAEYAKSPIDGKTIVLHRCSACHELMRPHMRYCPNCGRKCI